MTPEKKTAIEDCVVRVRNARAKLGEIDREKYSNTTGSRFSYDEPTLDFEQRHAVALAEVNELEAELLALTGPPRSIFQSLGDTALAPQFASAEGA